MAEPDKGTASSSKAKEKISELDDDTSKSFLGSWSTILNSDDTSMDFNFEPVTKGKKKEFDFDKLDMDFSLDVDFGKMNSFKVDMGDLDFSSPTKISTKSKETDFDFSSPPKEGAKFKDKSEGESAKSNKRKDDCFAFSFDFNELDKFDLDAVLPTRTKELNKDDGNRRVKIDSVDKLEHHSSKMQSADTEASDADAIKSMSMLVKASNSKENLVACNESYEEPRLQNQSAQAMQNQTTSKPALISSAGEITDHTQRADKQSDQLAKSCKQSYEQPKVQDQSALSFMDKKSALDVSEQMEVTSAANKAGDEDSKMQALNVEVDPPLTLENEKFPVKKMVPHYESVHLEIIPEAELESTDGEKYVPKSCNVMQGDMHRETVTENAPHTEEGSVDLSKLGGAESLSGRKKALMEAVSSNVSRFNLKPSMKEKTSAATQALPTKLNLISLSRNATSSLHPSPSGASAQNRRNLDKNSGSFTQETIVSDNMKTVSDQGVREHSDAMGAQMKNNLDGLSVQNDGKAADRETISEKKKEDTQPSSFQVQSSLLPNWTSKSDNHSSDKLMPKIPSLQSVRKLKMDTVVGKLSTLTVSKKLPNFSSLRISSSPALEDKIVTVKKMGNNGTKVPTKTVELVGAGKQQSPAPSIKQKIAEASDPAPIMLHPSKRVSTNQSSSPSIEDKIVTAKKMGNNGMKVPTKTVELVGAGKQQSPAPSIKRKIAEASDPAPIMLHPSKRVSTNQSRNSKEYSEGVAQPEVGFHKNILDCRLKSDSNKQPESTFEMKSAEVEVTTVMENDEIIEKAEACGKELDRICSMLRKKQEEAKELLVRVLVTNNKLLLLRDPMHTYEQKSCQVQNLASRLISREIPSKTVDPVK